MVLPTPLCRILDLEPVCTEYAPLHADPNAATSLYKRGTASKSMGEGAPGRFLLCRKFNGIRLPMNVPLRNRHRGVASDSRQRENIAARLR